MMVVIPQEKLDKLEALLRPILFKKKILVKDLESLTGLLVFCSRAIPSSRTFIRRFYDLLATVKERKPYYHVRVNLEVKADVVMLLKFLEKFNGHCFFPEKYGKIMILCSCILTVQVTQN